MVKPFTSPELDVMLASLRNTARTQERATKAAKADTVEATRSAINKVQALRMKEASCRSK